VVINASQLISDFARDLRLQLGVTADLSQISHDCWTAPHKAKPLRAGCGAVYVFSLSRDAAVPAGAGRILKIGKAGANSNARFQHQHYSPGSAMSTLAVAILNNPLLWPYIGYSTAIADVGTWIRENTDRDNFYFTDASLIGLFESMRKLIADLCLRVPSQAKP
jgi:hypothetical protein